MRIGVDIGGTFTKAALLDPEGRLLGRAAVATTYAEGLGVGVARAVQAVLQAAALPPDEVRAVVISSTQAVNALLEGDTVPVGVLAYAPPALRKETLRLTRLRDIPLAPGKHLQTAHRLLKSLSPEEIRETARTLRDQGAEAFVVTAPFSVEDPEPEERIRHALEHFGLPVVAGHEMTGLYGLEVRTFTAAVNAGILPRMREVLEGAESRLRALGIRGPILAVQGDLTLVTVGEAIRRPLLAMLSGPAASVAGALYFHRITEGLFVEVGGTSTNVGVVRGGEPVLRYVRVMDFPTALRSVDVRVVGVAGGSLIRLKGRRLVGIGPRSAHHAGLPYPSFLSPKGLEPPLKLRQKAPVAGDASDYAVVVDARGRELALTPTDAAQVLGFLPERDYARGYAETARLALGPLADHLRTSVEEAARRILDAATEPVLGALRELTREYRLREPILLGLGGGASVLVPWLARRLGLPFRVVPYAEVISAIGNARMPVRVEVERRAEELPLLDRWIERLREAALRAGASAKGLRVQVFALPEQRGMRVRVEEGSGEGVRLLREHRDRLLWWRRNGKSSLALVTPEGQTLFRTRSGAWAEGTPEMLFPRLAPRLPKMRRLALFRKDLLVVWDHPEKEALRVLLRLFGGDEPVTAIWEE